MGTRDAIGILRSLGEKSAHITKPYEKAFGRVICHKLMRALMRLDVDWIDRRLIYMLYVQQSIVIRINGIYSEPCRLGRGVRVVHHLILHSTTD